MQPRVMDERLCNLRLRMRRLLHLASYIHTPVTFYMWLEASPGPVQLRWAMSCDVTLTPVGVFNPAWRLLARSICPDH